MKLNKDGTENLESIPDQRDVASFPLVSLLFLCLETLESLLVCPSFDGEVGLGVEANPEDDNCEKRCNVAREFPILPVPRFTRKKWCAVEKIPVAAFLRPITRPTTRTFSTATGSAHKG